MKKIIETITFVDFVKKKLFDASLADISHCEHKAGDHRPITGRYRGSAHSK